MFNGKLECIIKNVRLLNPAEAIFLKWLKVIVKKAEAGDGIVYAKKEKTAEDDQRMVPEDRMLYIGLQKLISLEDESACSKKYQ